MAQHVTLEPLCSSILEDNKDIQTVAIINNKGRPIEKISKPEFTKQYPDYMNELFCMTCVLQVSMGKDFDENFGPINYYLSERESLITLTFPVGENIILVATNKNVNPITLARKISCMIYEHGNYYKD